MPSRDQISQRLEELCSEYSIALRLEQHERVSSLCLDICDQLIQLFDEELLQNDLEDEQVDSQQQFQSSQDEDKGQAASVMASDEWRLVNLVCQKLRKQSILAQLYGEVLQFVRQRERQCLDYLRVELANDSSLGQRQSRKEIGQLDLGGCVKVLRRCVTLLRELPNRFKLGDSMETFDSTSSWLPKASIKLLTGVGFPRYSLTLENFEVNTVNDEGNSTDIIERLLISCKAQANDVDDEGQDNSETSIFYKLISSRWFEVFLSELKTSSFRGFDRFSILVALWIVASECNHAALEQLLCELTKQIFHQETNSCQLDEFLLLTQAGAVWLSYKKRVLISSYGFSANSQQEPLSTLNDSESDSDSELGARESSQKLAMAHAQMSLSSSSSSSSNSIGSFNSEETTDGKRFKAKNSRGRKLIEENSKSLSYLRALIDRELLIGQDCLLCSRKPSGHLLEPLQMRECPQCSLELIPHNHFASAYCNASLQPLNWFLPLADLIRLLTTNESDIIVLSPNEWVQHAIEACASLKIQGRSLFSLFSSSSNAYDQTAIDGDSDRRRPTIGEQVDISERFERLTVLRSSPSGDERRTREDEQSSSESGDDGRSSPASSRGEFADFSSDFQEDGRQQLESVLLTEVESNSAHSQDAESCLVSLDAFFKWRYARICSLRGRPLENEVQRMRQLSESLQLIKRRRQLMVAPGDKWRHQALALNAADLLVVDSLDESIKLCLKICNTNTTENCSRNVTTQADTGGGSSDDDEGAPSSPPPRLRQRGGHGDATLLACHLRSQTSQLQRGCGRLFQASALLGNGNRANGNDDAPLKAHEGANEFNMAQKPVVAQQQLDDAAARRQQIVAALACPVCGNELAPVHAGGGGGGNSSGLFGLLV